MAPESQYDRVVRNADAAGVEISVVNGAVATRQGRSTGVRSGRRLRPVA